MENVEAKTIAILDFVVCNKNNVTKKMVVCIHVII